MSSTPKTQLPDVIQEYEFREKVSETVSDFLDIFLMEKHLSDEEVYNNNYGVKCQTADIRNLVYQGKIATQVLFALLNNFY